MKKTGYILLTIIMTACCMFCISRKTLAADTWVWPVPSVGIGQNISTHFGQIIDAAPNGHEGIDIYSGMGTRIVASRSGTVCRVLRENEDIPGIYYGAGNGVVIDHGNGIYSHYIHMSSTAVSTGQYVQAGATIGYMGKSGNADGVHLHFAIATNSNGGGGRINNEPGNVTYTSIQIANEGDSFEGYLIVQKPWLHIVMNKDTGNVEIEPNSAARRTAQGCWRFDRQSDGSYIITSLYNGKVLDVSAASSADGTNVQVYTRWGGDNAAQRWFLCSDGTIATKLDTNKKLDVTGGIMSNGTNIQIFSANGTDAQNIYPYKRTNDSPDPFPSGMTIDEELVVSEGDQAQIHSTFTPQNSRETFLGINWSSSDESIASVDSNGVISGIKAGTATITAVSTFNDQWISQCEVTVESSVQTPEITSLSVAGYNVDLSWEASPPVDDNDVRVYEVCVYKDDNPEVLETTYTDIEETDLQFTVASHGNYRVTVAAVNLADGSRSKDVSRAFTVLDGEWIYYGVLPDDLPECEIQYLNHFKSIESAQSPGEGWVQGASRKIYNDAGVMYSPDPNPLQESDTLVLLGTYYYHYCNRSGSVEHYQTGSYNHEVILDNWDGRFEIVWQGADDSDSRYTVYRLKWLQSEYAGYPATCSEGSDLYYRGYRYQKKTVTTVYTWTKEDYWSEEPDPEASSVSYRVRQATYENRLVLPAGTERIEEEAFINNTSIEEVTVPNDCVNIGSKAFAGCTGLKRAYIPKNAEVADNAFEGCNQVVIIRY